MLGSQLQKLGLHSDWVKNGKLGVEKISQGSTAYYGIITDVQMPLMDGLEATQRIHELGFTKPIIGFSSSAYSEDIARGLEAGMDAYLEKSLDKETMQELVTKLGLKGSPH